MAARQFCVIIIVLLISLPASPAFAAKSTELYRKVYRERVAAGFDRENADWYATGYSTAKEAGLTDSRAKTFAEVYAKAYGGAREDGKKCPADCEAIANDFAWRMIRRQ